MAENDTSPSTPSVPVRRAPRKVLWATLALVLVAAALTAGFVAWAVGSEGGTRALLGLAPGLRVTGSHGSLLGGDFSAARVEILLGGRDRVVIEDLAWQDLAVHPDSAQAWRFSVHAGHLSARTLAVELPEPSRRPKPVPRSMALPFGISADRVEVGTLTAPGLQSPGLTGVRGRVALGADGGSLHDAQDLQATWGALALQGQARMASAAPFAVEARLDATRPGDDLGWTATATTRGPLAALPLVLEVRAREQRFDARATLTPFALQPLSDILAQAQHFDLQALHPRAPRTALTGELRAQLPTAAASSTGAPGTSGDLQLDADVRNERPGALDEGQLPVASLKAHVSGPPAADKEGRRRFTLAEATVDLADASGAAGRVTARGDGSLSGSAQGRPVLEARVDASVTGLRTRGLHTRAPALVFSGPVKLTAEALPLGGQAEGPARLEAQVDVKGQWLEGSRVAAAAAAPFALNATAQAQLARDAASGAWRVQSLGLPKAQVRADAGVASLAASLTADDRTPEPTRWRLQAQGGLRDFDLRVLGVGSGAARTSQQLSATMRADLNGPAPGGPLQGSRAWMQWASTLRGEAGLNLADSRVAGMPLDGRLRLQSGAESFWRLDSLLDAGGNHLQLEGRIGRTGDGATDQWSAQVRSGNLGTLVPLAQAFGIDLPALQGQMSAEGRVEGRWPLVHSTGRVQAGTLAVGQALQADQLDAQWQLGTHGDAPLNVDLTATNLRSGVERLNTLRASAKGTARAHTLSVQTDRAARPPKTARAASTQPAWMQALFAQADADGSLKAEGDLLQWNGRVRHVALQPVDATGTRGAPWLKAEPFELSWRQDARQRSFAVSPTLVRLFSAELRVSRLAWSHTGTEVPQFDLQADLTPLDVAPLLQRAQPDFGWSGDLKLGGHVRMKRDTAGVVSDIEIARLGGDLMITEDTGTRRLGLDALTLTVAARNGTWHASEVLSGRNLGLLKGEQTVQTDAHAYAPDAASTLTGQLNLQIEQLGSLGAWLPVATVGAGWRLSGSLDTALKLGGRLGAPLYTGELHGQKIGVRNGLEGVNLTDGTIDMVMSGEEARIRQFVVKAGEGTVTLAGQATFGEAPQATLQLVADRFALLQRVDRRVVLSGEGQVNLDATTTRITGALRVDEGLFDISRRDAPSIGDDVDVVQAEAPDAPADTPSRPPPKRRNQIDLRVNAGDHLRLRGRGLDTLLKGELRFATNTANRLQVTGTILAEDGTYTAYGQKLNLDKGRLEFRGAGDNPRLDIEAIRPPAPGSDDTAVRVGVAITGTAQEPRVRLFSVPEMSETDKLSWLVLGRSSDGLGRTDLIVLQRAAVALLSDEGDDPSQSVFGKLGIDELSVSQGDGQVKETIVKVGKQLSQRWYVGYERSLNATSGTWQLLYRIAQRYSIRAQAQQGGASSLDFIWTWRWE